MFNFVPVRLETPLGHAILGIEALTRAISLDDCVLLWCKVMSLQTTLNPHFRVDCCILFQRGVERQLSWNMLF